jgi:hypothetical protein
MRIRAIICIAIFCLLVSCSSDKEEWAGSVAMEDGVTVIKNPVQPLYGDEAWAITPELTIGEKEGAPEYMFQSPRGLAVNDQGDIYVLDFGAREIKMYDKQGRHIKTIGRRGQGPGELYLPLSILWTEQDRLLVGGFTRLSYFDQDGTFIKATPTGGQLAISAVDCDGNFFGTGMAQDKGAYEIRKYDPKLKQICSFGTSPFPNTAQTGRRNPFFTLIRADIINGNQIVTGYAEEGYVLKIYDGEGTLLRRIEKDYVPRNIDQEDVDERTADDPPEMKLKYDVPKHFPPFRWLLADDEGGIWVLTFEKTPDREMTYMDVFDSEGKYYARIPFKATPMLIKKRKIYVAEEDEEGYLFIKRYAFTWKTEATAK